MDNLARGWAIFWAHMHGHPAIWIAILLPIMTTWFTIWIALRKKKDEAKDPDDGRLTPKRRAPLPGPDRGFR